MVERDRDGSVAGCNMKSSLVKAGLNYAIQLESIKKLTAGLPLVGLTSAFIKGLSQRWWWWTRKATPIFYNPPPGFFRPYI